MLNRISDGRVDLELSRRIAITHHDTPKTKNFIMSGPVKFDENNKLTNLLEIIHTTS